MNKKKHKNMNMSIAGGGIFSFVSKLKSKVDVGKKIAGKLASLYSSQEFKRILDFLPSSDDRATQGYAGEMHSLVKLSPSRFGIASFLGPGTALVERIKRDGPDSYRTPTDAVSEMHDAMYYIAQMAKTKEEQIKLVREADLHMVRSMELIKKDKLDYPINIAIGMRLIQLKMKGEDLGALQKGSFSGQLMKHPANDVKLVKNAIKFLSEQGY
tara:strand:- start:19 stop:657 length:639 start_codon:yes stop_codon:yes gene_type:complete